MPKKNNILKALNELDKVDVYSMMLFAIYKLKDVPEYSTLSELCYILDNESLLNFLNYYGGMTIKIPTQKDLKLVINALFLYQYVNIEKQDFTKAIAQLEKSNSSADVKVIKDTYEKILPIMSKYDFRRK